MLLSVRNLAIALRWRSQSLVKRKTFLYLFVPSIVAPLDNNILINEFHPQFPNLTTSLNKPIIWDRRLFIDPIREHKMTIDYVQLSLQR
jgi:RES domain-containing protein